MSLSVNIGQYRRLAECAWLTNLANVVPYTGAMAATRRVRKSGSLYQRSSDGMWVASVDLPPIGGKRRRKVIVRAKKGDAQRELQKLRLELDKRGDLSGASPTFEAWCKDWCGRYLPRRKPTGWPRDRGIVEHYLVPILGKKRIDRITVADVHRVHAYVTDAKPAGLGLTYSTANGAHRLLSTILEAAFSEELVPRNIAKVAGAPPRGIVEHRQLTPAQAAGLLADLEQPGSPPSTDLALMALSFFTGMRPAERVGLTRDMIDLDAGTITVAWQLQRISFAHGCPQEEGAPTCGRRKGGYCPKRRVVVPPTLEARRVEGGLWLTRPKTKAGWRTIPMVGILHSTLTDYLAAHEPGMEGLVFTRGRGGRGKGGLIGRPIDPAAYTARWRELLDAAGLPPVTPQSARRTCNSFLAELGVPVDVRTQILGHAGARVNEAVYTHIGDARKVAAMETFDQGWKALTSSLSG